MQILNMHLSGLAYTCVGLLVSLPVANGYSRPAVTPYPKTPSIPLPVSPPRDANRTCTIATGLKDAGPAILEAAKKCNNGGTVVFPAGSTYTVATALDLTFLSSIDFAILGTVAFKDDLNYWQANSFKYSYQDTSFFWRFGGTDVNIFGGGTGTIDGLGNTWWTAWAANNSIARPILFGLDGLHGGTISGLKMKNPPNWFNLFANSTDIITSDMNLSAASANTSVSVKNSDGWDTYRSSNIVIQNSVIVNTDDCVSFKPNSTEILVQGLTCTGSHGISVGSLGQYQGEKDIVENIYIYNISMTNASDAARIKVWPGVAPGTTGSSAGGGTGYVRNVTYDKYYSKNNDQVITLTQCYFATSQDACNKYPAELVIEDVLFKEFTGTSSKKYDPRAGSLVCSSTDVCKNIAAKDIRVAVPSGKNATYTCTNMETSILELNCTS
ncbi:murein transglycosylase [Phlyctema vagabunda]|uniref:galacturonan 1,4-alpha-galacturonidase n=1 Tax=Phlyctema vagabunda TaxID=108571 RepID=A0ABR4PU84_9HELO